ncbi:MAG: hypothetical protein C5B58_10695 [Acidobacteria bacterium]|nr:MAG: hypothetical protein C5B58_10695 [Acidobacteriota bacterium]
MLYVARASTNARLLSVDSGVGSRLPAYCTSMGRVLLAYLPETTLPGYIVSAKLVGAPET